MKDARVLCTGKAHTGGRDGASNFTTRMLGGSDAVPVAATAARNLSIPRVAQPEDVTQLMLFLASDEARFSTGSEFLPNSGHMLG